MDKKLEKAVKKLTSAYAAWVMAGAEYNTLVHEMTGNEKLNYTINFTDVTIPKITKDK